MSQEPRTPIGETYQGSIKVGSEILMHLGQGIYSTEANAIKELITNSYDADAKKVTIRVKPDMDSFVVVDDGEGMNEYEFDQHFAIVARSFRRDHGLYTKKLHRPIIGRFGIGFLAISQICDRINIISSKEGEPFRFEATIDFEEYRSRAASVAEYQDIGAYSLTNHREDAETHYTIIMLEKLAAGFRDRLSDKSLEAPAEEFPGRYSRKGEDFTGRPFEEIAEELLTGKIRELRRQLGGYWVFLLELTSMIPVPYLDQGPVHALENGKGQFSEQLATIEELKSSVAALDFSVDFDGVELRKPFNLPSASSGNSRRTVAEGEYHIEVFSFDQQIGNERLAFRGYLYNQRYSISPSELHGLAVRVKHLAIGGMNQNFLGYPAPEKLFFQQSMGEIYVDHGLEDAMNIDRATFRIGHPHYSALQEFIHRRVAQLFRESRARYVRRRKAQELALEEVVLKQLSELFGVPFEVIASSAVLAALPITLDTSRGIATVYRRHATFQGLVAAERRMRASDLILFEAAFGIEQERNRIRNLYYRLLAERDGSSEN